MKQFYAMLIPKIKESGLGHKEIEGTTSKQSTQMDVSRYLGKEYTDYKVEVVSFSKLERK